MPNWCDFTMKIKGTKENCLKWLSRMNDYEKDNHFYRMEASLIDEEEKEGDYAMILGGCCAWSLESCCRASGYSNGVDLFEVNSRELGIDMEAWSTEPGIGFQEHYIYKKGECLKDECLDYVEYYYDPNEFKNVEEFIAEYGLEEEFDENNLIDEYYSISNFSNYGEFSI